MLMWRLLVMLFNHLLQWKLFVSLALPFWSPLHELEVVMEPHNFGLYDMHVAVTND